MDSRLLYLIVSLVILVFCLRFSQAANEDGYIGCFNENLANPILPYQKIPNKSNPVRPNRCRNLCAGYRFFGLRNGTECWCGNADYAFYGAAAEAECNLPCGAGNAMCGGYNVSSVYRWSLCSEVCNNHSLLCVDSGVNKEITTCVNCQGNTVGGSCQNCIPDYYGFPSVGACQACNCGAGAFNSTCNVQTGQCICGSGFQGLMCDTCIDGKFVSGSTCMDCECGIGSLSNTCNQISGQCTCKNYFTGRTCSECEDGRFVQAGACSLCNCGIGASSIACDQTTGQCNCNPNFGGLTCSTCNPGFELIGSECVDLDECALGTHDCGSDATCTNTLGSYTCTCNPGYSGNGRICSDVNECTLPSHNCSASATCTNSIGGFSCECNSGFNGDGYVCTDIDECADPQLCDPQASCVNTEGSFTCNCPSGTFGNGFTCSNCTCGFGASSPICNTVTGACTCLPGFDTPFCNECKSGFFGSNCAACLNCVHGTCNDKLSGDGQCSCDPGWATPLCDICSPGFFGPNCAGVCPSCGHGSCLEGLLGNGSCVCEAGWKTSSFCSQCQDGFYLSNDKCLACDPSCKTCSGGSSTQCLSCPVSRVLNSGSCVNLCPSGKFQDSNLICQSCDSTCLECTGSSATSCLSCPSNRIRLGNSCVTQCPQEFYNSTGTCLACHSSCASCDGSTQNDCLTCPTNFFLNPVRGKCVNVCPDGMFPNPNSVCQTCHTSCLTCNGTSDSSCLSCDSGKIFFENRCLASCPTGYSKSPSGTCQKCECNKHATECDAETGECFNCGDNTSGPHCNLCLQDFTPSNTSDGFFCNPSNNPTTNANAVSSKPVAIGIGVAVGVLVMALIGIALIVIRSRKVQRIDPGTGKPDFEDVYGSSLDLEMACSTLRNIAGTDSGAPTLLNTEIGKELSLPGYLKMNYQEDIRIEKNLAGGGGGSIFMGSILNPDMRLKYPSCADRIAIKKIFTHDSLTTEENNQLFYQEVSVMSALSYHSNIAKVLFYTEDPNAIVFPLYESDLHRLIHSPSLVYSPPQMRDILLQISMGMQAIHGLEIAHRDLKPANFLLEPNPKAEQDGRFPFTVKITDFGVCHVSHSSVASQKFINVFGVSVKYAAPEVFSRMILKKFEGDIAELMKSDTFSFAISAWELITRKHPWEGLKAEEIQAKVVAGERPPLPESTHDPLLATLEDLTRLCWHQEHAKRPTFKDVAAKLVRLF